MIISLITALYLMGIIAPDSAFAFLYVYGFLLLIAEFFVGSFGMLAITGVIAVLVGRAIQTATDLIIPGLSIDWSVLFGITFVEFALLALAAFIYLKHRGARITAGTETMVGAKASVISWDGTHGLVLIEGEQWKAQSAHVLTLTKDQTVTVQSVNGLTLHITA
jgi:membrane-bound serine protease (ClpP class)